MKLPQVGSSPAQLIMLFFHFFAVCPGKLILVCCDFPVECHAVYLSREKVTSTISFNRLHSAWSPDKVMQYLLVGGLMSEAVWFAGQLGDWKTQLILSGVIHYHEKMTNSTTRLVLCQ